MPGTPNLGQTSEAPRERTGEDPSARSSSGAGGVNLTPGPHAGLSRVARIPTNDNTGSAVMYVATNTMSLDYRTDKYQYQQLACPSFLLAVSESGTVFVYLPRASLDHDELREL